MLDREGDVRLGNVLRTGIDAYARGSVAGTRKRTVAAAFVGGAGVDLVKLGLSIKNQVEAELATSRALTDTETAFLEAEARKLAPKKRLFGRTPTALSEEELAERVEEAKKANLRLQSNAIKNLAQNSVLWRVLESCKEQIRTIIEHNQDKLDELIQDVLDTPSGTTINSKLALAEAVIGSAPARNALASILETVGTTLLTKILTTKAVSGLLSTFGLDAGSVAKNAPKLAKILPILIRNHGEKLSALMPIAKRVLLSTTEEGKKLSAEDIGKIAGLMQDLLNDRDLPKDAADLIAGVIQGQLGSEAFRSATAQAGLDSKALRRSVSEIVPILPKLLTTHSKEVADLVPIISKIATGGTLAGEDLKVILTSFKSIVSDPDLAGITGIIGHLVTGQLKSDVVVRAMEKLGVENPEALSSLIEPILKLGMTILQEMPIGQILSPEHLALYTTIANNFIQKLRDPDSPAPTLDATSLNAVKQDIAKWVGNEQIMNALKIVITQLKDPTKAAAINAALKSVGVDEGILALIPSALGVADAVLARQEEVVRAVEALGDKRGATEGLAEAVGRVGKIIADSTVKNAMKGFLKTILEKQIDSNTAVKNKDAIKSLLNPALDVLLDSITGLNSFQDIIKENGAKYFAIAQRLGAPNFALGKDEQTMLLKDVSKILKSKDLNLNSLFSTQALANLTKALVQNIDIGDKKLYGFGNTEVQQILQAAIPIALGALNFVTDEKNLNALCTKIIEVLPKFLDEKLDRKEKEELLFSTINDVVEIFGNTKFKFSKEQESKTFFDHVFDGLKPIISQHQKPLVEEIQKTIGTELDVSGENIIGIITDRAVFGKMHRAYDKYSKGGILNMVGALGIALGASIGSEHARGATVSFLRDKLSIKNLIPNFARRWLFGKDVSNICATKSEHPEQKDLAACFQKEAKREDAGLSSYFIKHRDCKGLEFKGEDLANSKISKFSFKEAIFGKDGNPVSFAGSHISNTDFSAAQFKSALDLTNTVIDAKSFSTMIGSLKNVKGLVLDNTRLDSLDIKKEDLAKINSTDRGKAYFKILQENTLKHKIIEKNPALAENKNLDTYVAAMVSTLNLRESNIKEGHHLMALLSHAKLDAFKLATPGQAAEAGKAFVTSNNLHASSASSNVGIGVIDPKQRGASR